MDKKAIEALTSFGMTEYEAKVYLALVVKGVQKASALADLSDIPRPHVYSVIKLLHEKGLIIIIPEKVAKYQALPLDTVINKLLDERMASIKSLESIGRDLSSMIKDKNAATNNDDIEKVQLYNGRWAIIDLLHKMMGRATSSCEIITNDKNFVLTAGAYEQDFATLGKKNVQARLLVPIEKDTFPMIGNLSRRALIRHLDSMDDLEMLDGGDLSGNTFLRVVVIDDAEVLFVRAPPGGGEESAIWTSQRELARMIRLMFKHMWRNAPDVDTKKNEIETGRKPEHLTPIYGDAELDRTIRMIMSRAKKDLSCVLSTEQLIYNLSTFVSASREMSVRGVKVRVLVPIKSKANRGDMLDSAQYDMVEAIKAMLAAGADVRHPLDESILRMVMGDDEVTFNLLGESLLTGGGNIGVYTNHQDSINRIKEYFDKLWGNSVDASERLHEISQSASKEILKDGEEGLKKYFERLSGLGMGHYAIKSSDQSSKTIVILCTDEADIRTAAKRANGLICDSARSAFRQFGEYIFDGARMECEEICCVTRGDSHCEFRLHSLTRESNVVGNELLKFFESIKSEKARENPKA